MSKGARSCRYAGDLEPAYWRDTADNRVPVNMGGIAMEENTERDEVYEQFMQDLQAKKKKAGKAYDQRSDHGCDHTWSNRLCRLVPDRS